MIMILTQNGKTCVNYSFKSSAQDYGKPRVEWNPGVKISTSDDKITSNVIPIHDKERSDEIFLVYNGKSIHM